MAQAFGQRHSGHIVQIPRRVIETSNPTLAQHNLRIALREHVLRAHQQVIDRGRNTSLEQYGSMRFADFGQQDKVLHVAGTDLNHVGILGNQFDIARIGDFGNHRHLGRASSGLQNLQALFAQSLKCIRLVRGLYAPPRKMWAPDRLTAAAMRSIRSGSSTEQGPAIIAR